MDEALSPCRGHGGGVGNKLPGVVAVAPRSHLGSSHGAKKLWPSTEVIGGVLFAMDADICPPVFVAWEWSNSGSMAIGVRQPGDPGTEVIG